MVVRGDQCGVTEEGPTTIGHDLIRDFKLRSQKLNFT